MLLLIYVDAVMFVSVFVQCFPFLSTHTDFSVVWTLALALALVVMDSQSAS